MLVRTHAPFTSHTYGVAPMAKKTSKKPAAKSSKKPAGKPAKKSASKKAAKASAKPAKAAPAKKGGAMPAMTEVSTGKGPSPREIGTAVAAAFNQGKGDEVAQSYWSSDIASIEGSGQAFHGKASAIAKGEGWSKAHTVLGAAAEGPYVGATGFALKFRMHVRVNATGQEIHMDEVGVYTVRDGKIIAEEFMYGG